jgi:hypothetical protein
MVTQMKFRDQLWRWSSMLVSIFPIYGFEADHLVYAAWMHPELEKKGWNTVLNKGEIYNNCTYDYRNDANIQGFGCPFDLSRAVSLLSSTRYMHRPRRVATQAVPHTHRGELLR